MICLLKKQESEQLEDGWYYKMMILSTRVWFSVVKYIPA